MAATPQGLQSTTQHMLPDQSWIMTHYSHTDAQTLSAKQMNLESLKGQKSKPNLPTQEKHILSL